MRPTRSMRGPRPARVTAGALIAMISGSAVALAAEEPGSPRTISISLSRSRVGYGRELTVSGTIPAPPPGQTVSLQFEPARAGRWQTFASEAVRDNGRFSFRTAVRESGLLRALASPAGVTSATTAGATSATSASRRITVAGELRLRPHTFDVLGGTRQITVRGSLLPAAARRRVRLEARRGGAWRVLATAGTGPHGGFQLRFRPSGRGGAEGERLRVWFAGDRLNARVTRDAGRLVVFREALASWYEDGGATACGFHAALGVAHRWLPCGTRVTFRYRGREITAVVDDRGPFGSSREWDLSQRTAGALGFEGVAPVWSTS